MTPRDAKPLETRPIPVEVRAAAPGDLETLVGLYRSCFPAVRRRPIDEVRAKLRDLFFDGAFVSSETPSLVACDADGLIVGFRGWFRRRWRLGDELLFARTENSRMVREDARRRGVASAIQEHGRGLIARHGPEWFAFGGDAATEDGARFTAGTQRPGLDVYYLQQYGFDWELRLRPLRAGSLRARVRSLPVGEGVRERLARAGAALLPRAGATAPDGGEPLRAHPLSPAALAEAHEALAADFPLRLDEPIESWRWLLDFLSEYPSRGSLHARLLSSASGAPVGYYLGYLRDRGLEVVGFGVLQDQLGSGLGELLREGARLGLRRIWGRSSARQLRGLIDCGATIRPGLQVRINTPRPDIRLHFESMRALHSGLEGERWT